MKFKLTEPNKSISRQELIDDLLRIEKIVGGGSVTKAEYDNNGIYSYRTYYKRFGSWKKALEEANLHSNNQPWGGNIDEQSIPNKLLIEDLKRLAIKLKKDTITLKEYGDLGAYSTSAVSKRFGSWNNAKKAAGLSTKKHKFSDEDLFENLLHLWESFERQPKYSEVTKPLSKINVSSYERRFGTWRNALLEFIDYVNENKEITDKNSSKSVTEAYNLSPTKKVNNKKNKDQKNSRTNRRANLRQRYFVLKRDGFKCVLCGASPANNPKCELQIDHIKPWSKGGETIIENLQTLCFNCNQGKSNL